MRNVFAITIKEFKNYFISPIAYTVIIVFLLITGHFFCFYLFQTREPSLNNVFGTMIFMLVIISPVLTMRLLAEEKKTGTIELLMTSPVTAFEVILGKYLASFAFYCLTIFLTVSYPLILIKYGEPDIGPIITGYLGFILLGGVFLSVGIFASAFTKNQVVAAFLSFGIIILFWAIGLFSEITSTGFTKVLSYISLMEHFTDFGRGIIDTKNIIYYLSWIIFFLYLAVKTLEAKKWQ